MEFCEKGSLERAVSRGKFVRREDKRPELVRCSRLIAEHACLYGCSVPAPSNMCFA
jgi:hypothetical protein